MNRFLRKIAAAMTALVLSFSILPTAVMAVDNTGISIQFNGLSSEENGKLYYNASGTENKAGYVALTTELTSETKRGPEASGGKNVYFFENLTAGKTYTFEVTANTGYKVGSVMVAGQKVTLTDNKFSITPTAASQQNVDVSFEADTAGMISIALPEFVSQSEPPTLSKYNSAYQTKYGTVEFSADKGNTYHPLSDASYNAASSSYEIKATSILLKITWTTNYEVEINSQDPGLQGSAPANGKAVTLAAGSWGVQFNPVITAKSLLWTYTANQQFPDALVEHGKITVDAGTGITDRGQIANGGDYLIEAGTLVTIHLVPDYGYQLGSASLNGFQMAAGAQVSTFTFTMPSTALHLSALFVKSDDVVNINNKNVTSASVANVGNVIDSGNVKLDVNTFTPTAEETQKLSKLTSTGNTEEIYADLSLTQFVNKGTASSTWDTSLTELDEPVTITLNVNSTALAAGDTCIVVRNHEGTYTEIPATVNAADSSVSFDTNQFSDYILVIHHADKTTGSGSSSKKVGPSVNTADTAMPYSSGILFLSAALIAAVLFMRKKYSR